MLFKKPYAFLIKNFRLINFILFFLFIIIIKKTYNISAFFNDYIVNNYSGNYFSNFYTQYISTIFILSIILSILLIISIIILFFYKKKPFKVYISSVIFLFLLVIYIFVVKNSMISLEEVSMSAEASRNYRDFTLLLLPFEFFFMFVWFFRALGLNIKNLNFESDLKELSISENDSEEIEVNFDKNIYKYQRIIRRFFREFKYYLKENRIIFYSLLFLIIILSIFLTYQLFPKIYDKKYSQNEIVNAGNMSYKVVDSIVTDISYNGNKIIEDGYYVVVKIEITNNTNDILDFDTNKFKLVIDDTLLYPIDDLSSNFIDYTESTNITKVSKKKTITYPFIYKINSDEVKKSYKLKIDNGFGITDGEKIAKYNYINITPVLISDIYEIGKFKVNTEVDFSNSNLMSTFLTISNPKFVDRYSYTYEKCNNDICNTYNDVVSIDYKRNDTKLLVFDYNCEISSESIYYKKTKNPIDFIMDYGKLEYTINEKTYYSELTNVTTNLMKNEMAFVVSNKVLDGDNIYLSLTIRNKKYMIELK